MKIKILEINNRKQDYLSFIQYGAVGVIGTFVHTLTLTLCIELFSLAPVSSTIVGFIGSLIISYKLNSVWTFKKNNRAKNSFVKYAAVCSVGLIINIIIMYVVVDIFRYSYFLGQCLAIIFVPLFNFILSKYWAFAGTVKHTNI